MGLKIPRRNIEQKWYLVVMQEELQLFNHLSLINIMNNDYMRGVKTKILLTV